MLASVSGGCSGLPGEPLTNRSIVFIARSFLSLLVLPASRSRLALEVLPGRALEAMAVKVEARAVAGAIPRGVGLVELDDAAHVRADGRHRVQLPVLVAVGGDPVAIHLDHPRLAIAKFGDGGRVALGQPVADEALGPGHALRECALWWWRGA